MAKKPNIPGFRWNLSQRISFDTTLNRLLPSDQEWLLEILERLASRFRREEQVSSPQATRSLEHQFDWTGSLPEPRDVDDVN